MARIENEQALTDLFPKPILDPNIILPTTTRPKMIGGLLFDPLSLDEQIAMSRYSEAIRITNKIDYYPSLVALFRERIRNQNHVVFHAFGDTGSGKSSTMLKIMELRQQIFKKIKGKVPDYFITSTRLKFWEALEPLGYGGWLTLDEGTLDTGEGKIAIKSGITNYVETSRRDQKFFYFIKPKLRFSDIIPVTDLLIESIAIDEIKKGTISRVWAIERRYIKMQLAYVMVPKGILKMRYCSVELWDYYNDVIKTQMLKDQAKDRGLTSNYIGGVIYDDLVDELIQVARNKGCPDAGSLMGYVNYLERALPTITFERKLVMRAKDVWRKRYDKKKGKDGLLGIPEPAPIVVGNLKSGFVWDREKRLAVYRDNHQDSSLRITAKLYFMQQYEGKTLGQISESLQQDGFRNGKGLAESSIHERIGRPKGKPKQPLSELLGHLKNDLADYHETYIKAKWENWDFIEIFPYGTSKGHKSKKQPDHVFTKGDYVVFVSCKSHYHERDQPIYKDSRHGHTGLQREIIAFSDYETSLQKLIALEFANAHPSNKEETLIIFDSPSQIPEAMSRTDRERLKAQFDYLLKRVAISEINESN